MKKSFNRQESKNQEGSIIVSIIVILIFLTTIIYSLIVLSNANLTRARSRVLHLQAQYAAESGADVAISNLNNVDANFVGSASEVEVLNNNLYRATYSVSAIVGADSKERIITATGRVYAPKNAAAATYTRKIEVIAKRTSTTTSSSMLSRNIIEIESGVKNISGRDVYVNGYIVMHKNTTNLIAENITVADKNTGATNCSIGGTGNLIKPSIFSDPAQTKTKVTVAYNNCINPPGNTSNANFDVLANQVNIGKVSSTFVPWSQFMDGTYQNSPTGCSDWTTGISPRSIPSTGNTKKTHYPDNGNSISSSCGSSGDLALGSNTYHIKNHVHLRANLCASAACEPTFYNPDPGSAGIKYVFIEGTINFDAVKTAAGSGPIVFITYGADPASKSSVCPLGGSIYIGKSNAETSAPAAYFLALNGICLEKTKFSTNPALGGLSGKNLYISTNSGSPFDLYLDTSFPVDQIPIDLAFRATRYRVL